MIAEGGGRTNNISFDDYNLEGNQRQSQSNQSRLEKFLPDKNILSKVFWMLIQASPFGVYTYLATVILEDLAKVAIAGLILVPNELDIFLGFDLNSLNDKTISQNHAITNIIITGSFVGTILLSLFCLIYLYRAIKSNEDAESDALPQVIAKIQTIFIAFFGTFLSIGYQWFTIYTFYFVGYSSNVSSELKIIQIILSTVLILLTILLIFVHDNFYNLLFINTILVCGRPSRSTSYVIKPAFIFMMSAFSIKPYMTHFESSLFLFLISTYSMVHLLSTAIARMYYERTLDKINLVLKVIKTGSFITMLLVDLLLLQKINIGIVFVLVTPCVFGVAVMFKSWTDKKIYNKLSHGGVSAFKDCGDLEHALYIVLDFLDADDPIQHARFQGLMIANEEKAKDEEQSYYTAITTVIHMHEKLQEFGYIYEDEEEEAKAAAAGAQQEEEEQVTPMDRNSKQDMDFTETSHNLNGSDIGRESEKKPTSKNNINQIKKKFQATSNSNNSGIIDSSMIGETVNHKLGDIFSNNGDQSNGIRRGQQIMMQKDRNVIKINGIDIDVSNLQQAVKMIKLRYVYEMLVKQACQSHNEEIVFLLMKAYISMDLFHNKYLALTAITHVSVLSQKLGYKEQLISTISMNYFLKTILDKKGNQSSQHSSSTSWISQSLNSQTQLTSELDSGLLLEQSLQIDETINFIKMCSFRIGQFWQITSSETVTSEQIASLQQISGDISQMLGHIRAYVKQMESIESFQSSCQTLCFYIAHFFTLVIRDKNMGNMIFRQMNLIGMLGKKQQRTSLIDEIGVAVVDGNFGLYGKMVFANKIFLRLLGYQAEQIQGKLIHCLMPSSISEVHNLFWTAFSQMGIPKVLDQLRYLFVKDSKGYIAPFKIFIKFQFSPKYGYSFVGLFRRPTNIVFDEQDQSAKIKQTYQMICNYQGKILEISKSCRELMKLTPQIIETLHASMQENFLLSFFNQNLIINQMDFSKHSCVQFKNIPFNISLLKQFSQSFEFTNEEGAETDADPFSSLKENFRCQMKIIKETYGNTNSAFVTLYYVIFTEVKAIIDHSGNMTSNNVITESNNNGQPIANNSSMSGGLNDTEFASLAAINRNSNSEGSLNNRNISMSSTASSSVYGQSEDDIKMVEEGIDYDKIPKPIVYLQLSLTFLFICLIVLGSVQYSINIINEESNLEYQKLLGKNLLNQELISQLGLMSRTYMNIKTGYEPPQSDFIQDRASMIREMALNFIEKIRINLQDLKVFFKSLSTKQADSDINDDGIDDVDALNFKNVTMFSLLANNNLSSRKVSRFYSLNMWLVNLYEVFIFDNFTSKIGTFTNQNIQTQKLTSFDQTLFYILANGQYDLKYQFDIFIDKTEKLIDIQVDYTVYMNKYYVAIASVLVILLIVMSIYFVAFVLRFKLSVLSFFSEIDRKSMIVSSQLAKEFYLFLVTDEKQQLNKSKRILEDFQQEKLSRLENELQAQSQFALLKELKDKRKIHDLKKPGKKLNAKEVFSVKMTKEEVKKGGKGRQVIESISEDEVEDSGDYSSEEEKQYKSGSLNQKQQIKKEKSMSKRQGRKKKKKGDDFDSSDEEKTMDKNGIFQNGSKDQFTKLQVSLSVKNKVFAERLEEKMMSDLRKMIIVGIITAIIIVAYFVVQLVLISSNELQIKDNSQSIKTMLQSMECTNEFIYQVRKLQITNSSWYQLDESFVNKKIQFVPTLVEANNLNVTYQSCIKKNQKVDQLLQTYQNGKYQLQTKDKSNQTLCSYIEFNISIGSNTSSSSFNQTTCESMYQGVLQKTILQSTSVFLQDSLYSGIRYMTPQMMSGGQRTENYIRSQVASKQMIELLDAHTFCLQNGLRRFYSEAIVQIMSSLDLNVLTGLFILFMSVLVVVFFVIQIYVMKKVIVSFWHSFYILRLIPKDDIDREFIKRINDYLSKA